MSAPFVAEIRMFGFNFPPTGWAFCDGQLLPISQNTAVFSLLGTFYGGDGKSTFALPDLQGAVPVSQGQGAGLSDYFMGETIGTENVTLLSTEMPIHNHSMTATTANAATVASSGDQLARGFKGNFQSSNQAKVYCATAPNTQLNPVTAMSITGSSLPHNNLMPYLTVNFCIALQGVFPPRG